MDVPKRLNIKDVSLAYFSTRTLVYKGTKLKAKISKSVRVFFKSSLDLLIYIIEKLKSLLSNIFLNYTPGIESPLSHTINYSLAQALLEIQAFVVLVAYPKGRYTAMA